MYYRNSDFKKDTYYKRETFYERLKKAREVSKEVYFNEIRKINNSKEARLHNGDIYIQDIFRENWDSFLKKYNKVDKPIRKSILNNVDHMINCQNPTNGAIIYKCQNCGNVKVVMKTCKSRFCPRCGKKYRDKLAISVSKKILKLQHRQLVFTIPPELRDYFRRDRKLLTELFKSVTTTLTFPLKSKSKRLYRKENRRLGFIQFMHTYGRDMKWHPHIHVLFAEAYIKRNGEIHKYSYLPFELMRKVFLFDITNKIRRYYKDKHKDKLDVYYKICSTLKDTIKKHSKGSYFYGPKLNSNQSISSIKAIANYIARYASHPAISERRIIKYNPIDKQVQWFYDPHEDDTLEADKKIGRITINENVEEFIKRLIIHIPDKNFHLIRYCGFYSNKAIKTNSNIERIFDKISLDKLTKRNEWKEGLIYAFGYNPLLCNCGNEMIYSEELSIYKGEYG